MSLRDEVKKLNEIKSSFSQKMAENGKQLLSEEIVKFFKENPEITKVGWIQYTPYFNDGDECVFGVGEPAFLLEENFVKSLNLGDQELENRLCTIDEDDYDGYFFDENSCYYLKDILPENKFLSLKEFSEFICGLVDVLKIIFGDHCQITIGRNDMEFTVEEFEHD